MISIYNVNVAIIEVYRMEGQLPIIKLKFIKLND